jgi:hypothetical protein
MSFLLDYSFADAEELVRKCQGCQFFAKQQHVPAYKLVTIPPTWPFACRGLDMIGPLPTMLGGLNRVLVAIDKFTKWIEVKPVTCPKGDRVLDLLDELVHRYGLPHRIITDLGFNFDNHQFWEYYKNNGIDVRYVSVTHPRTDGQVERANRWYSTPSRSDCTTQLTPKEASGSRNYPMHSKGFVLNLRSQQGSRPTSWSTAPKLFYPPT